MHMCVSQRHFSVSVSVSSSAAVCGVRFCLLLLGDRVRRDAWRNSPHWRHSLHIIRWCLNNYRSHYRCRGRSICWPSDGISTITTHTNRSMISTSWWFNHIRLPLPSIIVIRKNNLWRLCCWTATNCRQLNGYYRNWNPYQIRNL